jgi:hypothetical protein
MNDLFKALAMLQDGVKQYATTKVLNDANEQVAQLRDANIQEGEKMAAMRNLSTELTRRLSGLGMAESQIKGVANSIAPEAKPIQSAFQGLIAGYDANTPEGAEQIRTTTKDYLSSVTGEKLLVAQAKAEATKGQDSFKKYDKYIGDFVNNKSNKPMIDAYNTGLLSPEDFTNPAEFSNKLRSKLKQAGESRPTDRDLESADIDPSLWGQLKASWSKAVKGEIPKERADLLSAMDKMAQFRLAKKINERVGSYSKFVESYGVDPARAEEDIINRHFGGDQFKQQLTPPAKKAVGSKVVPNTTGTAGFLNQGAPAAADWKAFVE